MPELRVAKNQDRNLRACLMCMCVSSWSSAINQVFKSFRAKYYRAGIRNFMSFQVMWQMLCGMRAIGLIVYNLLSHSAPEAFATKHLTWRDGTPW